MVTTIGNGIVLQPKAGAVDSLPDGTLRRQRNAGNPAFSADVLLDQTAAAGQKSRTGAAGALQQLLRRRTDRGEPADQSIEIPPHLERRRAWREAFGLTAYHAQHFAQKQEAGEDALPESRSSAVRAYRGLGRSRLDLDLAQLVSVTV